MRFKGECILRCWTKWTLYRKQRIHDRKIVKKVFNKIMKSSLAAGFRSWYELILHEKHVERLMMRVAKRLKGDRMERYFSTWADNVYQIKQDREESNKDQQRVQQLMTRVAMRMRGESLWRCFSTWQNYWKERLLQRKIVNKVFNKIR